MSPVWTIIHFEETFIRPLESRLQAIEEELKRPPPASEVNRYIQSWEECVRFLKFLPNKDNATQFVESLSPALDENGTPLPNYFLFHEGQMRAYYRLDYDEYVCLGILVHHDSDSAMKVLTDALSDAIGSYSATQTPRGDPTDDSND